MNKITLLLFALLFFFSCKDDDDGTNIPPDDDMPQPTCEFSVTDFTEPAINHDTLFDWGCITSVDYLFPDRYSYYYPTFNPNNSDEIAYLRRDNENVNGCNYELWTFSFCSGLTSFLTDGVCYSLDWSVKDWIVFTGTDRHVWKIKADGDSLTQLTNTGAFNNYPIWNHEGTRVAFKKVIGGGVSFYIITDEIGIPLDTIVELKQPSFFSWSSNNHFACTRTDTGLRRLTYFDLSTKEFNFLHELNNVSAYDLVTGTAWSADNQYIYWTALVSFNKTNISTGERTQIWSTPQATRSFNNLDISSDGKLAIIERVDVVKLEECLGERREHLYLVDIDGTNERKIIFPE